MSEPRRRRGLIAAGVLLLSLMLLAGALNRIFRNPSAEVRQSQQRLQCARNLGRLGGALLAYLDRFGEGHRYPDSLDALYDLGLLTSEQVLLCPAQTDPFQTPSGRKTSYRYTQGLSLLMPMETVLLTERGAPHKTRKGQIGHGLRSDLSGMWAPGPYGSEGWADLQRKSLRLARQAPGRLRKTLVQGVPYSRELAAWRLWRLPAAPAVRELRRALGDGDPEVRLYAALALLTLGRTQGMPTLLKALQVRISQQRGGTFLIEGPRRRWILQRLAADPRTRPVKIFAYDPLESQHKALQRWLGNWGP